MSVIEETGREFYNLFTLPESFAGHQEPSLGMKFKKFTDWLFAQNPDVVSIDVNDGIANSIANWFSIHRQSGPDRKLAIEPRWLFVRDVRTDPPRRLRRGDQVGIHILAFPPPKWSYAVFLKRCAMLSEELDRGKYSFCSLTAYDLKEMKQIDLASECCQIMVKLEEIRIGLTNLGDGDHMSRWHSDFMLFCKFVKAAEELMPAFVTDPSNWRRMECLS